MKITEPAKSSSRVAYEESASIASLLRSAANRYRVHLLVLAMEGKGDVSEMTSATALSKTALANHLSQLVESGLMRRQARGKYEITPDGKDLLSAALLTYRRSTRRLEREKEMIRRSFGVAYGHPGGLPRRTISDCAEYEPCWLSLLGAVSGSLNSLGTKASIVEVGGYTGYSFLINVSRDETCPSGPTALHIKTFKEILGGIECLGWRVRSREYPRSYPSGAGAPSPEDLKVARGVFERVRKEIDNRDRPVVLYGLVAPEYGIVYGYEGESYLVSTYRSAQNPRVKEDPVPYYELNSPGCIDEIYFTEKVKVRPSKARREALARALRFAEGDIEMASDYISGPPALAEWARVLEEVPEASQDYMGNSYVGACVHEGRKISAAFLRNIAKKSPQSESRYLSRSAASYSRGAKSLAGFARLFPFKPEGKMPVGKRRRGAALLREAEEHETKAVQLLKRCV